MSLRFALLGFLSTGPASGFDVAREFGDSLGWFWYASHSQIYPELRRLEEQGAVQAEAVMGAPGKQKRLYSLTDSGRAELRAWLEEPTPYAPPRDVERLKLMFLDDASPSVVRRHLEVHVAHHEELLNNYSAQLRELHAGTFPRLVKRLASRPQSDPAMVKGLKIIAMQGNIARARTEIAWAQDALAWLIEQEGAS